MACKTTTGGKTAKQITRYAYDEIKEPRTAETVHAPLLPAGNGAVSSFVVIVLLQLGLGGVFASEAESFAAFTRSGIDGRRVSVTELQLVRDAFRIRFHSGEFHLLAPYNGRTYGALFIGRGSWDLEPSGEEERRYAGVRQRNPELRSLTGAFTKGVLYFTDQTAETIRSGGAPETGVTVDDAAAIYASLVKQQTRDWGWNVPLRIYRSLSEGRVSFWAFTYGGPQPPVMFAIDPTGLLDSEEVLLQLSGPENRAALYSNHRIEEMRAGHLLWCANRDQVDALHYTVETRVQRNTSIAGVASIRFRTLDSSVRVLELSLLPALRIREVSRLVAQGDSIIPVPLDFVQEIQADDDSAAVLFAQPLMQGEEVTIKVVYSGDSILADDGDGNYKVLARTSWYPNLGFGDRATFDLTFSVPRGRQVVSVGRNVSTADEKGEAVSVWKTDVPIPVAGFNYGTFRLVESEPGVCPTRIQVYTNTGTPDIVTEINRYLADATSAYSPGEAMAIAQTDTVYAVGTRIARGPGGISFDTKSLAEAALADAANSCQIYSRLFSPLPFERISVTQQSEWSFGQSWPTLIFLPYLGAFDASTRIQLGFKDTSAFIDQVGYHEMAHQWWGIRVGWNSYRDQWLSEGFAEFSTALVYEALTLGVMNDHFWATKRSFILEKPKGYPLANCEVGPISMGHRLMTPLNPLAYESMIYAKGAYVLHMLRVMMKDERSGNPDARFFNLLKGFLQTYEGRNASTEDFKGYIERHMVPELDATGNGRMDWFFDQWVYGTEIPTYSAEFDIEKADGGKWRIRGALTQDTVPDGFLAVVPLYVELEKGALFRFARMGIRGKTTREVDVTVQLPSKPRRVLINARNEVLSRVPHN